MKDEGFEFVLQMVEIFKALGDPNRLLIIKLLLGSDDKPCVADLARILGISQPAVSQHLKILKHANIVKAEKVGYHVYYEVIKEDMDAFMGRVKTLLEMAKTKYPKNSVENEKELNINKFNNPKIK